MADDAAPKAAARDSKRELITFLANGQEFAVDVTSVREIRVWSPATPLAHAPSYVSGVINLRGAILPIIDFAARLGLPPTAPTTRHAILVAQARHQTVGLLVEGVTEILTVSEDEIQATPDVGSRSARDFITGILTVDKRMVGLIAIDAVAPEEAAAA